MYAVRGSWVGQTFALAASNNSREKKSRNRCSKEERKALAESFIKRYQSLNEGNFPSLNLTHKEVGGSFYTVREIVREIIQENKVLGPAKYTFQVNEDDTNAHDYPLGSISMEPQDFLLQSQNQTNGSNPEEVNGKQAMDDTVQNSNHQGFQSVQGSSDPSAYKIEKDSNGIAHQSEVNNENLEVSLSSNGKSTDVVDTISSSNESGNPVVNEKTKVNGKLGLVGAYNAKQTIPTEEVEVETFPLRPAAKETNEEGSSSITATDTPADVVTEKGVDGSPVSNSQHEVVPNFMNHNGGVSLESQSLVTPESSQAAPNSASRMSTVEVSKELDGFQGATDGEKSSKTSCDNASKEPRFISANEYDALTVDQSKRATSPTLDRINLESWPRTPKQGSNPILALIEAFKDAFVNFWSA